MGLIDLLKAFLDKVDRSYALFCRNKRWVCVTLSLLLLVCVVRYIFRRLRCPAGLEKVIKYLLTSSARHIDSAVSLRNSQPLVAYEHAIYGAVMANTAKDLVDDKTAFSQDLGVDVYAYLEYTNQVVTQLKHSIK